MKVVDLGTRHGLAITTFLHKVGGFFPDYEGDLSPADCLGVDADELCRHDLEGQGMSFLHGDMKDSNLWEDIPDTEFVLVCNVLHHLPDEKTAKSVLTGALGKASYGVWLRVKSFEDDRVNGEGLLHEHGMKFCWADSHVPYKCAELFADIKEHCPEANIRIEDAKRIRHTNDKRVVPEDAIESGSFYYDPLMGGKEHLSLPKPVVCEWDIFVEK